MSYKRLGKMIQLEREKAGLNQEQLASMLGCSQPTLSNYEKGKSRIYLAQLQKVAELLNKPSSYFLEAMEPVDNDFDESASTMQVQNKPQEISLLFGDQDILKIIKILSELPEENRKEVYEFIMWQQYKTRRDGKNG